LTGDASPPVSGGRHEAGARHLRVHGRSEVSIGRAERGSTSRIRILAGAFASLFLTGPALGLPAQDPGATPYQYAPPAHPLFLLLADVGRLTAMLAD
jgi:hypothetical protein